LAAYRVFRGGLHPDRVHTADLLFDLRDNGIPKWIEANQLADCLSGYGIKPRQMKINNMNRNGYDWHAFLDSFGTYISNREIEEIEKELGLIPPTVGKVEVVDGRTPPPGQNQYWG